MDLVDYTSTRRVSLIGVLGITLACKHPDLYIRSSGFTHPAISVTSIRAIGRRAHPMHAMVSFSTVCILMASVGYAIIAPGFVSVADWSISMVATKTKAIIPTRLEWVSLLAIGIFSFFAQVRELQLRSFFIIKRKRCIVFTHHGTST